MTTEKRIASKTRRKLRRFWNIQHEGKVVGATFYSVWGVGERTIKIRLRAHEIGEKSLGCALIFCKDRWEPLVDPIPADRLELHWVNVRVGNISDWIRHFYRAENQILREALVVLGEVADLEEAKRVVLEIERNRSTESVPNRHSGDSDTDGGTPKDGQEETGRSRRSHRD